MRTYRINCIDDADHVVSTFDRLCIDDLDALDRAKELCEAHGVEVWDGTRRVVWMYKGGAARLTNALRDFEATPSPLNSTTCPEFA